MAGKTRPFSQATRLVSSSTTDMGPPLRRSPPSRPRGSPAKPSREARDLVAGGDPDTFVRDDVGKEPVEHRRRVRPARDLRVHRPVQDARRGARLLVEKIELALHGAEDAV